VQEGDAMSIVVSDVGGGEFVACRFEPCGTFVGDGTAVCVECGWLAEDHPAYGADLRVLPRREVHRAAPDARERLVS
jgi:hypothetical protein